jgi:hypothetical protein
MSALILLTLLGVSLAGAQDAAEDEQSAESQPEGAPPASPEAELEAPPPPLWSSAPVAPPAAVAPSPPPPMPVVPEAPAEPEAPRPPPPMPQAQPGPLQPLPAVGPVMPVHPPVPPPVAEAPRAPRRYDDGRRWRNGMPLLWVYSCGMGSLTGAALGGIASDGELAAAGMYLGGGAGALGMVFLRPDEISLDQTTLIGSSGLLGAWSGAMLASSLIPEGAESEYERITAAGVLGAAGGTAVGSLLKDAPPARDMLLVDVSTFAGWQVGAGIADLVELDFEDDRNLRSGLGLLGGGAFLVGSALASGRGLEVDPGVMGMTLGHGSWIGLWSPFLISDDPSPQQVLGGMRLGLGAGAVSGVLLSPHMDLYPRSVALQLGGAGAGAAVGAGVPLALGLDGTPRAVVAPMLLGGLGGQALGAALAPSYELTASDALLMGTIETWALYQGLGWAVFIQESNPGLEPSQSVGMGLSIAGAGTLVAGAMGPLTEFEIAESAMVGSGGIWGTWYGAWGGQLAGLEPEWHWLATLAAGNVGLVGTAAAAGGDWDPDWRTVGLVDSMGVLGGAVGAMVGVIASPDMDAVSAGALLGSTGGLVGGALLSRNTQLGFQPRLRGPLLPRPRANLPFHTRLSAGPWMAESGEPGAMVSLSLHEK